MNNPVLLCIAILVGLIFIIVIGWWLYTSLGGCPTITVSMATTGPPAAYNFSWTAFDGSGYSYTTLDADTQLPVPGGSAFTNQTSVSLPASLYKAGKWYNFIVVGSTNKCTGLFNWST